VGINAAGIIFNGLDTEEQKLKQAADVETQSTFWETLRGAYGQAALNNPVTSSVVKGYDKLMGDPTKLSKAQLEALYPAAPKEFYDKMDSQGMTRIQAAFRYAQVAASQEADINFRTRDVGAIGQLGYSVLGSAGDPTAILENLAGGVLLRTALNSAKGASLASKMGGRMPELFQKSVALYDDGIKHTVGQLLAREFAENGLGVALTTLPANRYARNYGVEQYGIEEMATGIVMGGILGTGLGKVAEAIRFRNMKSIDMAKNSMPNHVADNVFNETMSKEFDSFQASVGAHTPIDALKLGAYNRAKNTNTVKGMPMSESLFYNITEKTTGIDTSFESKYGTTRVFVNDPRIAEGVAQTAGADFDLGLSDFSGGKFVKLDNTFSDANPGTFKIIANSLPEGKTLDLEKYTKESGKSMLDAFDDVIETLTADEKRDFFNTIQDDLYKEGFTGYTYDGGRNVGGEHKANFSHTVVQAFDMMDGMIDETINKVKDLNYQNKKMYLEYQPQTGAAKTNALNSEVGYMTNGKTIKFNNEYFETVQDVPFEMEKGELEAFAGLFSKEQIDDVQAKVDEGNYKSISSKYKDLVGKKDLLMQVEDYKKFDAMFEADAVEKIRGDKEILDKLIELDELDTPLANEIYNQLNLTDKISKQLDELKLVQDEKELEKLTAQIHTDIKNNLRKDIYNQLLVTSGADADLEKAFAKQTAEEQDKLIKEIYDQLELTNAVYEDLNDRLEKALKDAGDFTPDDNDRATKAAIVCSKKEV
jgi:hypothetical protein